MWPVLGMLHVGEATVVVPAYATFVVVAAAAAAALGVRAARGLGVGWPAAAAGICVAIAAGLVGARLLSVVLDWPAYAADPGRIAEVRFRGFALYGGLVVGSVAALAVAVRAWRVAPARLADRAVVAVVAGIVLVRVGCFLNGCCAGVATDLPWGVTFPSRDGVLDAEGAGGFGFLAFSAEPAAVHPTQLYEIAAVLACCAVARALARRGAPDGLPALAFAALFLAFRAGDQVVRVPPPEGSIPGAVLTAVYAAGAAVVGCAAVIWAWRGLRRSRPGPGGRAVPVMAGVSASS